MLVHSPLLQQPRSCLAFTLRSQHYLLLLQRPRQDQQKTPKCTFLFVIILAGYCRVPVLLGARWNSNWITLIRQMHFPHQSCSSGRWMIYSLLLALRTWHGRENPGMFQQSVTRNARWNLFVFDVIKAYLYSFCLPDVNWYWHLEKKMILGKTIQRDYHELCCDHTKKIKRWFEYRIFTQ